MSNDSLAVRIKSGNIEIVIPVVVSNIGFVAALLCTILGSIINGTAMFVILKVRKSQKHFFLVSILLESQRFFFFISALASKMGQIKKNTLKNILINV